MARKKKFNFSLKKLIYNDKYLIIISIILAIVIWYATSMNLSPETSKTISVSVSNDFSDSPAAKLGIKCYGEENINVDVTISCKKYMAKDITAEDLRVYLQANNITSTGTQDVPIKVEANGNADFNITSYYPRLYRAYFDVEEQKTMDIDIVYPNGNFVEQGYMMGDPLLSENSITIKGPKAYISQVSRVTSMVEFDEMLTKTQSVNLTPIAVDRSGATVDYIELESKNENITLTIPIYKKTVLGVTSSFTGKPTGLNSSELLINYSVDSINAGVLEDTGDKEINVGNIDFSQITVGRKDFTFDINNADNIRILDDVENVTVSITVPNTFSTKTLDVDIDNVEITNVPEGYKAELVSLSSNKVTAVGKEDDLESISDSNVRLLVDLSNDEGNLDSSTSDFTVIASVDNNNTCWIYGDYSAKIRLYK